MSESGETGYIPKPSLTERLKANVAFLRERITKKAQEKPSPLTYNVLSPHIPESAVQIEFKLHEWNGFAVSETELAKIEKFMANPDARRRYADLYARGNNVRNDTGDVRIDHVDSSVAAVRSDGLLFVLDSMRNGTVAPSYDADKSIRTKGKGRGIFMTKLIDISVNRMGTATKIDNIDSDTREQRIVDSTSVYTTSSAMEVTNASLFPEARSEFWNELLVLSLQKGEDLADFDHLFQYRGDEFHTYLQRATTERSSLVWGLNRSAITSGRYRFGFGDFGKDAVLAEIDVQGKNGVAVEDIAFLAARPGSLEDAIGKECLKSSGMTPLTKIQMNETED